MVCLMLKVAHVMPLDRYRRKIEKLATQWPTAWHLVRLAEDKCRFRAPQSFEVANRVRHFSRTSRSASVGCWVSVVCNLLTTKLIGTTTFRHPAMSWLAHGSQSPRAPGREGSACRWYGPCYSFGPQRLQSRLRKRDEIQSGQVDRVRVRTRFSKPYGYRQGPSQNCGCVQTGCTRTVERTDVAIDKAPPAGGKRWLDHESPSQGEMDNPEVLGSHRRRRTAMQLLRGRQGTEAHPWRST